ncbi:MAG: S41 family peptidase [candidate division WOR-3 bacterium]|nr:MAG: S41 family peptidase [candidate division WOR-3 bacterium]
MMNLLFFMPLVACLGGFLQARDNQIVNTTIDPSRQLEIIDSVTTALNDYYIFPDVASEIEKHLRKRQNNGGYLDFTSISAFAQKLTEEIRSVSKDAHLSVEFKPDEYFAAETSDAHEEEQLREWYDEQAYDNFGFEKVEHLSGNIGYVRMRGFYETDWSGPTAIAAMNFLAHCDAVIFDLRLTLGGQPSMIQLLASYFFDEPVQLSSFYVRKDKREEQFWTHKDVSGPRMSNVKLYILTSRQTPSAAEAFAYDMKHLQRAIIIGETTSGAAHPAEEHWFSNLNIVVSIPYGRAINPITGTNWEGTGVEPHIPVPSEKALLVAHNEALKALLHECTDEQRKMRMEWALRGIEAQIDPVTIPAQQMKAYTGTYGSRTVYIKEDEMFYQRQGRSAYRMVPMGNDLFMLEGLEVLRIQFPRDKADVVREMIILSEQGPVATYGKEK